MGFLDIAHLRVLIDFFLLLDMTVIGVYHDIADIRGSFAPDEVRIKPDIRGEARVAPIVCSFSAQWLAGVPSLNTSSQVLEFEGPILIYDCNVCVFATVIIHVASYSILFSPSLIMTSDHKQRHPPVTDAYY